MYLNTIEMPINGERIPNINNSLNNDLNNFAYANELSRLLKFI